MLIREQPFKPPQMPTYTPKPVDTQAIELEPELLALSELLAKNTHEVWAQNRFNLGWKHGPQRDDSRKTHPSLIPYEALSEEEKDFDRATSSETLKVIKKLGFSVQPPKPPVAENANHQIKPEAAEKLADKHLPLLEIIRLWQTREVTCWKANPDLYLTAGNNFLKRGEPLLAYDVFDEGLNQITTTQIKDSTLASLRINLSHKKALALAETGALQESLDLLNELCSALPEPTGEILALQGRIHKQQGLESENDHIRAKHLEMARSCYQQGYELSLKKGDLDGAYFNGINLATLNLLTGNIDQSEQIANQVETICLKLLQTPKATAESRWLWATLGEVNLLKGKTEQAIEWYKQSIEASKDDARARLSMYKQAKVICNRQSTDAQWLATLFELPLLLTYDQSTQPNINAKKLVSCLGQLTEYGPNTIAYTAAVCHENLIFLDWVIKQGGEANLVLPYPAENVRTDLADKKAIALFDSVCTRATRVIVLSEKVKGAELNAKRFAIKFACGATLLRASNMAISAHQIDADKDQTLQIREYKPLDHQSIDAIAPDLLTNGFNGADSYSYLPMLFADVKGYSKLLESQLITFATQFMSAINQVFKKYHTGILKRSTQGDGLFVVFSDLLTALQFSSELKDVVTRTAWADYGLPPDLNIRISLDAGPCHGFKEPITNSREFCGGYINRAARIEPITPPGHIYASETFTALSKLLNPRDFKFAYSGQIVLPKNSGMIAAYHLYRCTDKNHP